MSEMHFFVFIPLLAINIFLIAALVFVRRAQHVVNQKDKLYDILQNAAAGLQFGAGNAFAIWFGILGHFRIMLAVVVLSFIPLIIIFIKKVKKSGTRAQ